MLLNISLDFPMDEYESCTSILLTVESHKFQVLGSSVQCTSKKKQILNFRGFTVGVFISDTSYPYIIFSPTGLKQAKRVFENRWLGLVESLKRSWQPFMFKENSHNLWKILEKGLIVPRELSNMQDLIV